ncbi:polynucleotide kinase-phosphatase [Hazenella sp. IB182357]|uniref:Polynucleotide kinase-phosphatase n=1 Tax=Polycladospora coralii TaxID=2771432 RepID=A0A926NA57_9BACL|nr:polynucleotide kinase-phosphatase [Polycladospora coralii]MBD1371830.1 polynucleotide kinase-phosphatase [Polycladospora coralii]MBS7529291.1 polynucleotide kinase-phosphatase [Polycladospora coralii]
MDKKIVLPAMGIVLLVGPSNSGKTTLLARLIEEGMIQTTEVVGSDQFRMLLSDQPYMDWTGYPKDQADVLYQEYQEVSEQAFEMMEKVVEKRCRLGKLTFVDATHLHPDDRAKYLQLGLKNHVPVVAVGLDVHEKALLYRDQKRDYPRGKNRIKQQNYRFREVKRNIKKEGFHSVYMLQNEAINTVRFERLPNPLWVDCGAGVDFIGDIHGCYDELIQLLKQLGYRLNDAGLYIHPTGRKFVSLGDIMSRGPKSLETISFIYQHVKAGLAYMIDSNHGWKIARWLNGNQVKLAHGDERVAEEFNQFEQEYGPEKTERWKEEIKAFLIEAPAHLVFQQDGIKQVVAVHAGIRDRYIGKQSKRIADFCRYGDVSAVDEHGKPTRDDWFVQHQSAELIVWGHDPQPYPMMVNRTINIDQGVVFGGALTAFRFPEKNFVSVKSMQPFTMEENNPLWKWKKKRFSPPNMQKLITGYGVQCEGYGEVKVRGESVKPAVDLFSHFTIPLEAIPYLPPTMSPPEVARLDGYLEHPAEAIAYYRKHGIMRMIAQKKHMGSRAVLLIFRDAQVAKDYIGYQTNGVIYTRTGRSFFHKDDERQMISRLQRDFVVGGYFAQHQTDYVLIDAEIMPWNLKAKELIQAQYAHVGEAAIQDRQHLLDRLKQIEHAPADMTPWLDELAHKLHNAEQFQAVFEKYCWDTSDIEAIQIAPFHILAHSQKTFFQQSHEWHMEQARKLSQMSSLMIETAFRVIESEESASDVVKWWEKITEEGHEGIVIKPDRLIRYDGKGSMIQPALKVRGRKYLSIIYGMDYLEPENLARLKKRNPRKKQHRALKEFALGVESINRFVRQEPVERIHEAVLAVLALESDPIDPRL